MTELTDHLVRGTLMDPDQRQAYHVDAQYHAEWTLFSRALDAAHRALVEAGNPEAEGVVGLLFLGAPDLAESRHRVREAQRMIDWRH